MYASAGFHLPIAKAVVYGTQGAPLSIETERGPDGPGVGTASFYMGFRPEDQILARTLADRINATIADHKRTQRAATMLPGRADRVPVYFEDISIPDLAGCVSFALVVEFADHENWIAVDVLSGSGVPDTWTTIRSIDLRDAFFAYAERPEFQDDILDAIKAGMAERRERIDSEKADDRRNEPDWYRTAAE